MFRPRQPLFEWGLAAAVGIVVGDFLPQGWLWALVAALLCLTAAASIKRSRPRWARTLGCLGVLAAFTALHGWRVAHEPAQRLAELISPQGCVLSGVGVVDEDPPSTSRFRIRLEEVTLDGETIPTRARILVHWPHDPPAYGDRLVFTGTARNLRVARNPGEFDQPAIRKRQRVHSMVHVRFPKDALITARDQGNPLIAMSLRLRRWMAATMTRDLEDSPDISAVIASVVLGSRAESMRDVQLLFAHTGTLHLFAVSGMNVAMIAASLAALLLIFQVPRRAIALIIIPLLWVYCFVTGLTPSSLRATIMATLVLGGVALDRPALSWNVFGASALLIVLWNSHQLFAPGFQLSFLLVAVLLLCAQPITNAFQRLGRPDPFLPRPLWSPWQRGRVALWDQGSGAFSVSLVAWLGSIPLTLWYFHLWSPSTVPANLIAGALAWVMLMLGLASAAIGVFWSGLSVILNNANWLFAKTLLSSTATLAALPGSHYYIDREAWRTPPRCEITVLDLQGGGAIHLRTWHPSPHWPHRPVRSDWLIDCASASAYEWNLLPYLRTRGVNRLDGLILTHGDSHHLGGGYALLDGMPVADVIDGPYKDRSRIRSQLQQALAGANRGRKIISKGDIITLAPGITLTCLSPATGLSLRLADDKALVFRLDVEGGPRLLFSSDSGFITEQHLLETTPAHALRADALIKGRHAADLSGTPAFLDAVAPALIITSAAAFPPQQQVDETWAAQVAAKGIRLLRQDETGAVRIIIAQDGTWEARPFIATPPQPLGDEAP